MQKDGIASVVSIIIIDRFKSIRIQHEEGQAIPVAFRALKLNFGMFPEMTPVIEAGERVGTGDLHQFRAGSFKVQFKAGAVQKEKLKSPRHNESDKGDGVPGAQLIRKKIDRLRWSGSVNSAANWE